MDICDKKTKMFLRLYESNNLVMIISILVGLTFLSPHILIPVFQKKYLPAEVFYTPLTGVNVSSFTIDETRYAGRINHVAHGSYFLRDSHSFEYEKSPTQYETFLHFVLGLTD